MTDFVELGIKVDSSQVQRASQDLQQFSEIAKNTGKATDQLATSEGKAKTATGEFAQSAKHAHGVFAELRSELVKIGTAILSFEAVKNATEHFIEATSDAQTKSAQLEAVLTSTGHAAGKTAEDIERLAKRLQSMTAYEDDAIIGASNLLLTFREIKGDNFDRAVESVLNLSAALGRDLRSSALQVGKALQDPAIGLTALRRSGVSFTQSQREMIKSLVDTGKAAEAQRVILTELEKEFGGAAEAIRGTLGGALQSLGNAWNNMFEISSKGSEKLRKSIEDLIHVMSSDSVMGAAQTIGVALFDGLAYAAKGAAFLGSHLEEVGKVVKVIVAYNLGKWAFAAASGFRSLQGAVIGTGTAMGIAEAAAYGLGVAIGRIPGVLALTLAGLAIEKLVSWIIDATTSTNDYADSLGMAADSADELATKQDKAAATAENLLAKQKLLSGYVDESIARNKQETQAVIENLNARLDAAKQLRDSAEADLQTAIETQKVLEQNAKFAPQMAGMGAAARQVENAAKGTTGALNKTLGDLATAVINATGKLTSQMYNLGINAQEEVAKTKSLFEAAKNDFQGINQLLDSAKVPEQKDTGLRSLADFQRKDYLQKLELAKATTLQVNKVHELDRANKDLKDSFTNLQSSAEMAKFFPNIDKVENGMSKVQGYAKDLNNALNDMKDKPNTENYKTLEETIQRIRSDAEKIGLPQDQVDKFVEAFVVGRSKIEEATDKIHELGSAIEALPKVTELQIHIKQIFDSEGINYSSFQFAAASVKGSSASTSSGTSASGAGTASVSSVSSPSYSGGGIGHFAEGGAAPIGKSIIVGEKGPELVTFDQNAWITPTDQTAQILQNARQLSNPSSGGLQDWSSPRLSDPNDPASKILAASEKTNMWLGTANDTLKEILTVQKQMAARASGTIDLASIFGYMPSQGGSSSSATQQQDQGRVSYDYRDPKSPYYYRPSAASGAKYDPVSDYILNGNVEALNYIARQPTNSTGSMGVGYDPGGLGGAGQMVSNYDYANALQQQYKDVPQGTYGASDATQIQNGFFSSGGAIGDMASGYGRPGDTQRIQLFKNPNEVLGVFTPEQVKTVGSAIQGGNSYDHSRNIGDVFINIPPQAQAGSGYGNGSAPSYYEVADMIRRAILDALNRP